VAAAATEAVAENARLPVPPDGNISLLALAGTGAGAGAAALRTAARVEGDSARQEEQQQRDRESNSDSDCEGVEEVSDHEVPEEKEGNTATAGTATANDVVATAPVAAPANRHKRARIRRRNAPLRTRDTPRAAVALPLQQQDAARAHAAATAAGATAADATAAGATVTGATAATTTTTLLSAVSAAVEASSDSAADRAARERQEQADGAVLSMVAAAAAAAAAAPQQARVAGCAAVSFILVGGQGTVHYKLQVDLSQTPDTLLRADGPVGRLLRVDAQSAAHYGGYVPQLIHQRAVMLAHVPLSECDVRSGDVIAVARMGKDVLDVALREETVEVGRFANLTLCSRWAAARGQMTLAAGRLCELHENSMVRYSVMPGAVSLEYLINSAVEKLTICGQQRHRPATDVATRSAIYYAARELSPDLRDFDTAEIRPCDARLPLRAFVVGPHVQPGDVRVFRCNDFDAALFYSIKAAVSVGLHLHAADVADGAEPPLEGPTPRTIPRGAGTKSDVCVAAVVHGSSGAYAQHAMKLMSAKLALQTSSAIGERASRLFLMWRQNDARLASLEQSYGGGAALAPTTSGEVAARASTAASAAAPDAAAASVASEPGLGAAQDSGGTAERSVASQVAELRDMAAAAIVKNLLVNTRRNRAMDSQYLQMFMSSKRRAALLRDLSSVAAAQADACEVQSPCPDLPVQQAGQAAGQQRAAAVRDPEGSGASTVIASGAIRPIATHQVDSLIKTADAATTAATVLRLAIAKIRTQPSLHSQDGAAADRAQENLAHLDTMLVSGAADASAALSILCANVLRCAMSVPAAPQ